MNNFFLIKKIKNVLKLLILGYLLFSFQTLLAQTKGKMSAEELDNFLQSIFSVQDEDINYADLYEAFYQLYTNPLDLNRAQPEELKALYLLSDQQIQSFYKHQAQFGKFLSIYELQAIEHWDLEIIRKILPFVRISESNFAQDNRPLLSKILTEPNNFLLLRYERTLQKRRGYQTGNYLGTPDQLYIRFRTSHSKDFSLGFTLEKDAGETGIDFWSFHAAIYNRNRLKALNIGDYQLQFGQGLILAGGFGVGKGSETIITTRRNSIGILPYSSVIEANFFRGIAATYELAKNLEMTAFASQLKQDAILQQVQSDTISESEAFINALQQTGFHRTTRERQAKGNIRNTSYGMNLTWRKGTNELGFTVLRTDFSTPILPIDRNYNQYEFRGLSNWNLGMNYSFVWQNFNFFGETAVSKSGGFGTVNGLIASLSEKWFMSAVFRHFDRNLHTFYGNAFSENTRNINETGFYLGFKFQPSRKITWTAYFDQFRFAWLKFLVDAPSEGFEILSRLTYTPSRNVQLYAQYRNETKGRNLASNLDSKLDFVVPTQKQNWQINLDTRIPNMLTLHSRVQFSDYQQVGGQRTQGFAIVQDVSAEYKRFQASLRFALFDTDDYDNRQYVFEKDVQYTFSIPAYYGRGFRNYYLLEYSFSKKLTIWFRYTYTLYRNQKSISSGNERIDGNRYDEIKMQLRWRL